MSHLRHKSRARLMQMCRHQLQLKHTIWMIWYVDA